MPSWRGWLPLIAMPSGVLLFWPTEWPRWAFMWALAFAIFAGCKWLTWRRTPVHGIPWWQHAGYLLAWPGLDAEAFLRPRDVLERGRPRAREWAFATLELVLGMMIIWGACRWVPEGRELLLGWVGMVGLILVLHFGSFH